MNVRKFVRTRPPDYPVPTVTREQCKFKLGGVNSGNYDLLTLEVNDGGGNKEIGTCDVLRGSAWTFQDENWMISEAVASGAMRFEGVLPPYVAPDPDDHDNAAAAEAAAESADDEAAAAEEAAEVAARARETSEPSETQESGETPVCEQSPSATEAVASAAAEDDGA